MKYYIPAVLLLALIPAAARADFTVDGPAVEKGAVNIHSNNSFAFDNDPAKDRAREHVVGFDWGVTDWWQLSGEGIAERVPGDDLHYTGTNIESVFSLSQPGEYWLDVGARAHYLFGQHGDPDQIEAALLLEKTVGSLTHTANLALAREVGHNRGRGIDAGFAWRTSYGWQPWLNPGIELYSEFGETVHMGNFNEQNHRLGPVVQGEFPCGLGYDIGLLFGLSQASDDSMLKINLEYGF